MKMSHTKILIIFLFAALPFGVALNYLSEQLPYANSPHLSSVWDRNAPSITMAAGDRLIHAIDTSDVSKSTVQHGGMLGRVDLMLQRGAGEYKWMLTTNNDAGLIKELVDEGTFSGNDFQNHDFLKLHISPRIDVADEDQLTITIERRDNSPASGIGFFGTESKSDDLEQDIVLQLYYR